MIGYSFLEFGLKTPGVVWLKFKDRISCESAVEKNNRKLDNIFHRVELSFEH